MNFKIDSIALAVLSGVLITSYTATSTPVYAETKAEKQEDLSSISVPIELTDDAFLDKTETSFTSYAKQGNALKVHFDAVSKDEANSKWPNIKLHPIAGTYDWLNKGGLKLKLENPGDRKVRFELKVADSIGIMGAEAHQLDLPIYLDAGETKTVDFLFNGTARGLEGYRGGSELDLKNIAEFQFYAVGPIEQQEVIIHSIDYIEGTGDFVKSQARTNTVIQTEIPSLLTVANFENSEDMAKIERHTGTKIKSISSHSGRALRVTYTTDDAYPTVKFSAGNKKGQVWDWSHHGDAALAFDAKNLGESGVQLFVRVDDDLDEKLGGQSNGSAHSRTGYVQIAPNSDGTYYFTLKDLAEGLSSGMRGEPPKKSFAATQVVFGWGEGQLNPSNIVSFQLYMMNPTTTSELEFDNFRLIPNLSTDTERYVGLVDKFGQYTQEDWPLKVYDEQELKEHGKEDLALAKSATLMPDRSKFGGWKEGPKLKGTGYFRTEKIEDKWALVDPEGYLYFVTGLDNIRLDDSYTVTGVDFADAKDIDTSIIRPSEISTGGYIENTDKRVVKSDLRHGMFTWLPDYKDKLADNYSFNPMVHAGPLKHGEVFSFYAANLQRKYGTDTQVQTHDVWRDVTLARMQDWGFTSLGNWSEPSAFYGNKKVPYTAHGWITGKHQKISTGNDYWGPLHDPFDPDFRKSVAEMAKNVADEVKNDPWCIGYFVDNELSWGNTEVDANHYSLAVSGLKMKESESSAKKAFDKVLKDKYGSIDKLNKSWGIQVKSWDEFSQGFNFTGDYTSSVKEDLSQLLFVLADQYFKVVNGEMRKVMPHHLNLGSRFSDWGITPEAAKAAAKYVDVMSYNLYAKDLESKGDWSRLEELDKPSIIGEFHFGALDSGLFHPGIVSADDQQGRADAYKHYMESIIANPYFIGAHWFQYMDSPVTGRAWDGENYNVGFVTVTDTPYKPLVEAAKEVNRSLYQRRYGNLR
ncbi:beta-galactosidase [Vibrio algivorus]|uniref:Beta-agarase n=1 Tax=Vibrio algivorus TaxID=1667024 RepID=A0ABQ6EQA3_9VIBR|nr:beta-galactosidase [Vibrio algivorus]GLT15337.1 hypothetical protein GCM10007931_23120 [Vibrio algivorus]